jgi:hypothetical protein
VAGFLGWTVPANIGVSAFGGELCWNCVMSALATRGRREAAAIALALRSWVQSSLSLSLSHPFVLFLDVLNSK